MAMEKKLGAALLSVGVNCALLASKIGIALITGSIALYAEAAHSLFDLFASVLAFLGIRKALEPSDLTHHFGHEKFEDLSSLLQAVLIAGTAMVVMFEAYEKFSAPTGVQFPEAGILLMLVTLPVTYFISDYLYKIAHSEGSAALEADSAHFATDWMGALAVFIGLVFVMLGFPAGDPLAAIFVAVLMLYVAGKLIMNSFFVFMDFSPGSETMGRIESVLKGEAAAGQITRFHKLRARTAGRRIFVDVHIQFPHGTPITTAHETAHLIEDKIIEAMPEVKEVSIHMEPD